MGRAAALTIEERASILALNKAKVPVPEIVKLMGRSYNVVRRFLEDPARYNTNYKGQRPRHLTPRLVRQICLEASKTGGTARSIKAALDLTVSLRTVQRVLHSSDHLRYEKRKATPLLKPEHKEARM
ncbi:hypothetical protein DYB32_008112, partial [Aphanomyces invadans]